MAKKKKTTHKHISTNDTHILFKKGIVVYGIFIFMLFTLLALVTSLIIVGLRYKMDNQRLERISTIYQSLKLDDGYRIADSDLFGDKRVYSWDKSRTYASTMSYGRNANVAETFVDLKKHIENAGFTQIEGPNYGAAARQDHYRNKNGEYIRVSINSKAINDAILYGTEWPKLGSPEQIETGPSYVTIKVNLDDNNE